MPRIPQDPNLEVRPDFASAAFDAICMALATVEGVEVTVVATRLSDAWDMDNNARREAWAEQERVDEADAAKARLTREADKLQELKEIRKDKETEKKEKEKKQPKLK